MNFKFTTRTAIIFVAGLAAAAVVGAEFGRAWGAGLMLSAVAYLSQQG